MVFNLRASVLISGLLPVAVLMVFISMKMFGVDANIVALSGIAIAIGTMVDVGVILSENIIRHLDENVEGLPINDVVYRATSEVSGAIVTAVMTTIISFIPVFTMIGAEGKLFRPLAFTKTMALTASLVVALFLIPPFAAFIFNRRNIKTTLHYVLNGALAILGFGFSSMLDLCRHSLPYNIISNKLKEQFFYILKSYQVFCYQKILLKQKKNDGRKEKK